MSAAAKLPAAPHSIDMLDLNALRNAPVQIEPFEYCIVPAFVRPDALSRIRQDFPDINKGGSFPLDSLTYGQQFEQLVNELLSPQVREVFGEFFDIDLHNRPATLTVRGQCRLKDGKIHTDSKTKLITVLLYLNEAWESDGGRLRLLRSGDDIESTIAEAPPSGGTLVAFRCRDNAWHGHKPFEGIRRSIQLNWVVDQAAAQRSKRVHGWSSLVKKILPSR